MRIVKKLFGLSVFVSLVAVAAFAGYSLAYTNLILPRIRVANIEVGGLDRETAIKYLKKKQETEPTEIIFVAGDKPLEGINKIQAKTDIDWAVDQAMSVGRGTNFLVNLRDRLERLNATRNIEIPIIVDETELEDVSEQVAEIIETEPVLPKLIEVNKEIVLREGKNGIQVNKNVLKAEIRTSLARLGKQEIRIPIITIKTEPDPERLKTIITMINAWEEGELTLRYKGYTKKLIKRELLLLIGLIKENIEENEFAKLAEEIKKEVETESKDAVFVFEEGRAKEFQPEVVGVKVDIKELERKLTEAIFLLKNRTVEIPVLLTYPKIRAGEINNMGIKELIGKGKSTFAHSIPGRVFNVNLAASRISGVIVPPGEEFSFNKAVGEISRTTGYQSAYVISEGKTVLGDGGGVCQVSTTTFRAALNAGLPIIERRAHAYRVGYYEQDSPPGIDATIFSPSTDLKFLNDTGHHILIQTKVDTKNMKMEVEIYGTSDGRVATISTPRVSNQTPPPPTVYVDDPTLPAGQMKQIDWSAAGAKVSFDYKVEREGEVVFEKTFFSNFQPWRAVYLRGTAGG